MDWSKTQYWNQLDSIKTSIQREISESGSASLTTIQQRFRADSISLRNLIRDKAAEWGVVYSESEDRIYPIKEN